MNENFNIIKNEGRLMYYILRGSHLHNLATEKSDEDYGGVYLCNPKELLGLGFDYIDQLSDDKHDNTWFEIGSYLKLLLKSNPTVMEYIFAPKDKIIGDVHPLFIPILENREQFISKQMFNSLFGYAKQQFNKCRGFNKLCNWDKEKITRKEPLDFCYTFKNQGSTKIYNWLDNNGLNQKYCGLVNTPNMHDIYSVYYDFDNHFLNEGITIEMLLNPKNFETTFPNINNLKNFIIDFFNIKNEEDLKKWYEEQKPKQYKGIISEDGKSNELRLSSVLKNEKPICYMSYNQNGYTKHCVDYKNYTIWLKERNPIRYESNLNKNYDAKNVAHMVRLIHMGIELAKGEGFNVVRTWDRDFILKVKNHGFEFDEIMAYIEEKTNEFNKAIETSTLKEKIDVNFVNDLLIEIRKKQLQTIL